MVDVDFCGKVGCLEWHKCASGPDWLSQPIYSITGIASIRFIPVVVFSRKRNFCPNAQNRPVCYLYSQRWTQIDHSAIARWECELAENSPSSTHTCGRSLCPAHFCLHLVFGRINTKIISPIQLLLDDLHYHQFQPNLSKGLATGFVQTLGSSQQSHPCRDRRQTRILVMITSETIDILNINHFVRCPSGC